MKNNRLIIILIIVVILLLIPFIAMQLTSEVNWTLLDFLVAGILLMGTGLICDLVIRKITNVKARAAICLGIFALLILIWAELAVGVFGSPIAGS